MSGTITIYAPTVEDVADWVKEQQVDILTCELQLHFATGELELYDYERKVSISKILISSFAQ